MKIGILVEDISLQNGTERAAVNLANILCCFLKYEVEILTGRMDEGTIKYDIDKKIKIKKMDLPTSPKSRVELINYYYNLAKKIRKIKDFDFIIGTTCYFNIILIFFLNKKIKTIACEHMNYGALKGFLKLIRKFAYRFAYKVILLTKEDSKHYEKFLKKKNFEVIPNTLSFKCESYNSLEKKNLISVGRLTNQKGYDLLLETFAIIKKEMPDWKLKIYGKGELLDSLLKKRKDLKLESEVEFIEPVSDIREKYLESSIYIMSSRWEGLPMVLLEAMACGLPLVSFNCPYGPSEVIDDSNNGFLVGEGNIEELAKKVIVLMKDKNLRKKMGQNSKIISQRYSPEEIKEKWRKIFSKEN